MVRCRGRHPRTPGRTAISVVAVSDLWNIRVKTTLWMQAGVFIWEFWDLSQSVVRMVENLEFALKLLEQGLFVSYFPGSDIYEPEALGCALILG